MERKRKMETKEPAKTPKFPFKRTLIMLAIMLAVQFLLFRPFADKADEWTYTQFKQAVAAGTVQQVEIGESLIEGVTADETRFTVIRVEDQALLDDLNNSQVEVIGKLETTSGLWSVLGMLLPFALMAGFWYWIMKRSRSGGSSSGVFSMGKSKARMFQPEQTGITFDDVGGAGEAVTDLLEVTEFLKDPTRFQRLGGRVPRGVLLVGPPGTGKTLLAKATAGQAGVPFFSLSGSEFVEMFVGVGASRVRDLFEQAKKHQPSIIFIDEIDAIGARRSGYGSMGTHEEREQTLNQLLAEMDGFDSRQDVIVMAATNRPEILDPALLRPGRFDRQVMVDLPDLAGRAQILNIHARGVRFAPEVDLEAIARITPGFSGADLANIINEAALLAARTDRLSVEMLDLEEAIERVMAGSERRTRVMNSQEKRTVAYHEAGHALVASLTPGVDPVHKVTIVPRGQALGYTMQLPEQDRYLLTESELKARLAVLLGGRAAEAVTFGQVSTGASDDLERATDLARRMVTEYGMSPAAGPVRLAASAGSGYLYNQSGLDPRVSPQTSTQVDTETRRIIEEALTTAWDLLDRHPDGLQRLAELLIEQETISGETVTRILLSEDALEGAVDVIGRQLPYQVI
jgi:cell division protease FtsH